MKAKSRLKRQSVARKRSHSIPNPGESTVARYHRIALLETVLSIRDRQERAVRRLFVGSLALIGVTVIVAGVMGWL